MLLGASSRSPEVERPASPKYSERLSPSVNAYLSEASRHEIRVIVPTLSRFHPQFFFPLNHDVLSVYTFCISDMALFRAFGINCTQACWPSWIALVLGRLSTLS